MILVCYDFDATHDGNMDRQRLRDELTSYPFYARMMTQSVYYLPESMQSLRAVRKWANQSTANIVVFGDAQAPLKDQKMLVKQYYKHLQNTVQEVTDTTKRIRRELLEFEENIEDPDVTLRGWATKVSSIKNRFEEIRTAINKVGDEDDEFHLDMVATFVDKLEDRYEKVKEMKIKINKEHKKNRK